MSQIPQPVGLGGGLDLVSASIVVPPGRARAALNHEPLETGYARVQGYERFDGRPAPSSASFSRAGFSDGTTGLAPGNILVGATSGATATLLTDPVVSAGDLAFGDATGSLALVDLSGTFQIGEDLTLVGTPVATITSLPVAGVADGADEFYTLLALAQDNLRADITAVPGSGPLRGGGDLNGIVYAFRDNLSGTAVAMYRATASGWQLVDLGRQIDFTTGVGEIFEGNTITGVTSGATAVVRRVVKIAGGWGTDASGYLVISGQSGTFQAGEGLRVAGVTKANAVANGVAITLPPGGRYICKSHNFYGASNLRRMYGVNGVGRGFEFDGTTFTPIRTGMDVDTPKKIFIYQNHLFFAFAGGSLQHSAPGEPLLWDVVLGAEEIGMGADITDMIEASETALIIFTTKKISVLSGRDVETFQLDDLTEEAGAEEYTAQRVGRAVYLDRQGLRTVAATQEFGNFRAGTLTELVWPFLNQRFEAGQRPVGSIACKAKTQYRIFWSDGIGLHIYTGGKFPEALPVQLAFTPSCLFNCDMADGSEGMFIGGTDGFLYRLDRGTSVDGSGVAGYIRFPYNRVGQPRREKRFHGLGFEVTSEGRSRFSIAAEFGPGEASPITGMDDFTAYGAGGRWDIANWDEFIWDAADEGTVFTHIDGRAIGVAPLIICDNAPADDPYTLSAYTPNWSQGKVVRG
jgi:hypothetical protein